MLRYVPIDEQGADLAKTEYLFTHAFPEEERPPFEMMLQWAHDTFFGVYEEDEYVGLVDLIVYQDLVYVFFLAIEPSHRNRGLGTRILSELKQRYPTQRLFLLSDEAGEQYEDDALRRRRLAFYERNGFHDSGLRICEFGVYYRLMQLREPVSKGDFRAVMQSLIGEENARRFYANI